MIDLIEHAEVFVGKHARPDLELFGPLPGRRSGSVLAYEMQAPLTFEPWPGRTRVERKYALLDVGVSMGVPCWSRSTRADGSVMTIPAEQEQSWYVDLVTVERTATGAFVLRDLFVDIMIGQGMMPRMLDLDELADACAAEVISIGDVLDGLRRWQRFLDTYVHASRWPQTGFSDFPPAAISLLEHIEEPFGEPVTWPD